MEDSAGSDTASVRDDCLHAFPCDSGARLDATCGFYDRVCYQKYTHRQHFATLEESAGGDAEGDRHHQWAAGNSLVSRADNLVLVKYGFSALSVPRFFGV